MYNKVEMNESNTIIKKDFWADGVWYAAFFLLPLLIFSIVLVAILVYGAYATFRYEFEHLRAGFLFLVFALIGGATAAIFAKNVWIILREKAILTSDRIIYSGFDSFSLPYGSIKGVKLTDRKGLFGSEKLLFLVARDEIGREKMYAIPRWHALGNGLLARELSKRMTLSLLDRNALSFYSPAKGHEWILAVIFVSAGVLFVISFLIARAYLASFGGIAILFWVLLAFLLIFVSYRYFSRKKSVISS